MGGYIKKPCVNIDLKNSRLNRVKKENQRTKRKVNMYQRKE